MNYFLALSVLLLDVHLANVKMKARCTCERRIGIVLERTWKQAGGDGKPLLGRLASDSDHVFDCRGRPPVLILQLSLGRVQRDSK